MSNHDTWKTTDRDGEDAEYQSMRINALWTAKMEKVTPAELIGHFQRFLKLTDVETVDYFCNFSFADVFDNWDADRQLDFLEGL
jgi:hypothetical protein